MSNDKFSQLIESIEPKKDLLARIMGRIHSEKRLRSIKQRLVIFGFLLLGSIVALVPVFRQAQAEFAQSGFLEYLSLIFSDAGVIASNWQSYLFALLESLPIISLAWLLLVVIAFLESLRYFIRNTKIILPSIIKKFKLHNS